ncbi:hypothetical protein TWF481_005306 [Arthrobotrys musiformis]|uniref:C2H2-type domain-containing protein n=1 Tax=Arthrobotrys musiformis TaxID=47236 RepID=A0AAV9WDC6_9PEZI
MSKRPHRSQSPSSTSPAPSPPSKYTRSVSPSPSTMTPTPQAQITCTLPTCPQRTHSTTESFETHYNKYHTNRCHDCLRNFPTGRILECHIRENHDMFAVVKKEKGEKIYACFVEDCPKICVSFGKRRAHLIDKHYYHKNFNFSIVDTGIDRATSLLTTSPPRKSRTRVRRISEASNHPSAAHENKPEKPSSGEENGMEVDSEIVPDNKPTQKNSRKHMRSISEPSTTTVKEAKAEGEEEKEEQKPMVVEEKKADEDTDMNDLTSKMSAIRFVPPSVVRFGRRGGGSGFSKK